jgi:glycosyltransferase involved in cell wall biosynthesis
VPVLNSDITAIVLTCNEEMHLPRILQALHEVCAEIFIIDSGSTDKTLDIANQFNAKVLYHPFQTHSQQWDYALQACPVTTLWVLCLDADQYPSSSLLQKLKNFSDSDIPADVNGIFINRHNYFQGKRLKYGGYRNFYMLKMFRFGKGHADLNEKMDHRFIAEGKTIMWKGAVLIEDNLKEHEIDFWIQKHLKYSSQVAMEELGRSQGEIAQTLSPRLFGNPDERKAWLKKKWWNLPLFIRPCLYFIYRFFFCLGFLENGNGRLFHFMHALWFRILVDVKLNKLKKGTQ